MNSLTDRQVALLIFGAVVGYGVVSLPKNAAQVAGTGSWFTLIVATILAGIVVSVIVALNYHYPDQTFPEYTKKLIGPLGKNIFSLIYSVYFFMIFTFITRGACEIIKGTILIKTPLWSLLFLFYLIAFYAITKGLTGIAKLCEIYGYIIIPGAFFIHFIIFTQGHLIYLQPFFVTSKVPEYLRGLMTMAVPFLGIEIITFIPVNKKNNPKLLKYVLLIVGIIGLLYIVVAESCIAVIGVDDIIHYKDALIATMRRVDIPFFEFLRRLDGLILSLWIMAVFCTISVFGYGTVFNLSHVFQRYEFNFIAFVIVTGAFVIAQLPDTFSTVEQILQYIGYSGLVIAVIFPSTLLILTKVKKQ